MKRSEIFNLYRKQLFYIFIVIRIVISNGPVMNAAIRDTLDLSGTWYYRLHNAPLSIPGEGMLVLPGTLDTNQKGMPVSDSDNTTQLSRRFSYSGDVSYLQSINIPDSWNGKEIELFLERTRPSILIIDGDTIGSISRLSSPHRYDVSHKLNPGDHLLEIIINNYDSIPGSVRRNSNMASEYTQTNWNGILGEIILIAKNKDHITTANLIPSSDPEGFIVYADLAGCNKQGYAVEVSLNGNKKREKLQAGENMVDFFVDLPTGMEKWSEWNPQLIDAEISLIDPNGRVVDAMNIKTGYKDLKAEGRKLLINDTPLFLRGEINSAVFPLTGYAPMDKAFWNDYFSRLRDYGLNHVRFHTWCPPETAFQAADEAGFYLQVELPLWGELDRDSNSLNLFLDDELLGILESYSSHPSFSMLSLGNELWGDISLMKEFTQAAKEYNPALLTTFSSNLYTGMKGYVEGEDFIVASRVGKDGGEDAYTRGSYSFADTPDGGRINSQYPSSNFNFSGAVRRTPVPLIAHEMGQYQHYPDFSSTDKYTGVLRPDNILEFKRRAQENDTYKNNQKFYDASGQWAARLYKADIEANLRTPGMSGFQLLGLQDYPGQGTALVGMIDFFGESNGFITPEQWRQFCSQTVILAELPRFTFREGETTVIPVKIVNYTDNDKALESVRWETPFASGTLKAKEGKGIIDNGKIILQMPVVKKPEKMTLTFTGDTPEISNSYDFWVFPEKKNVIRNVKVTNNLEEALSLLKKGRRVILWTDSALVADASLPPLFTSDFWNYRMYRTLCDLMEVPASAGTLGMYIDHKHPAFNSFATDYHTDWQWFPILSNSRPLIIDRLPTDVKPIVEPIDNVEQNYRLALMLECKVGRGKLMIIASDLDKASQYPEGEWLLQSIKEYMTSPECSPKLSLRPEQLVNLLTKPSLARKIKQLKNETYDSHWD